MHSWAEVQVEFLGEDGTVLARGVTTVTIWPAEEHGISHQFFTIAEPNGEMPLFDPSQLRSVGGAQWFGAVDSGILSWESERFHTPASATLRVDDATIGPIEIVREIGGRYDTSSLLIRGIGPPPEALSVTSPSGDRGAERILDAITEVERFTRVVEDAAETEAERTCARAVREGLAVLREFAHGRADDSITRAAVGALRTWAARLRDLAGYAKLVELGVKLQTLLDEVPFPPEI